VVMSTAIITGSLAFRHARFLTRGPAGTYAVAMKNCTLGLLLPLTLAATLTAADPPDKTPSVAPGDEFLRHIPKRFATWKGVEPARRRVTLVIEGESEPRAWELAADAEVKIAGWWGRPEQLTIGDRVWVWFNIDRQKKPTTVAMLADELSEQEIHGLLYQLAKAPDGRAVLTRAKSAERRLTLPGDVPANGSVYVQSAGDRARLVLTPDQLAAKRTEQQAWLRRQWLDQGLPGTVTLLHAFSGEMEVLLDHEAQRWARALKANDKVTIQTTPPVKGTVRLATPWREKTLLRLVVIGTEQAAFGLGQRCSVKVPAPADPAETSAYPPDIDRPRTKPERIDWFLATVYCTCGVAKDTCTGHFYTLASCNVNGCGMPNATRAKLVALIDEGKNDRQIFDLLSKERGPMLVKPHLLP
jgi:hypothetical protein